MSDMVYIYMMVPFAREYLIKQPDEAREAFLRMVARAFDEQVAAEVGAEL